MSSVSSKERDRLPSPVVVSVRKAKRTTAKRPRVVAPGPFASVNEAIDDIRRGRMVIVVDDEDRENEGDLTMAAELTRPEDVAFIRKYASGVICVPMITERLQELDLPQMVSRNEARLGTAFTVSVDAREGVTTGISAADRTRTIKLLADPNTKAHDLVKPGHIFPLQARDGGVLVRAGQTEAAVDLCRLAGLSPVGVICEITNPDGSMSRMPELKRFAKRHGLRLITVKDLIAHRMAQERLVERVATAKLPTEYREFTGLGYPLKADERERGVGVQILLDLGIRRARILTNNPQKLVPLYGLEVVERIPIEVPARATNRGYLATKRNKLGHLLTVVDGEKR